jgi:hypothetical protein
MLDFMGMMADEFFEARRIERDSEAARLELVAQAREFDRDEAGAVNAKGRLARAREAAGRVFVRKPRPAGGAGPPAGSAPAGSARAEDASIRP